MLKQLKKEGHEIYIITKRAWRDPYALSKNWLDNNGLPFDQLIVKAKDKLDACRENNIDIYLDDTVNYMDNLNQNGIKGVVLSNQFNKKNETISPRVNNFEEFYNMVKQAILQTEKQEVEL